MRRLCFLGFSALLLGAVFYLRHQVAKLELAEAELSRDVAEQEEALARLTEPTCACVTTDHLTQVPWCLAFPSTWYADVRCGPTSFPRLEVTP